MNTDEYLQRNELPSTEDPAYANVTVPVYTNLQSLAAIRENMVIYCTAPRATPKSQQSWLSDVKSCGEVLQMKPYRSMADRFNVLCTLHGIGGWLWRYQHIFAATAKGGISTNKGNWRNHVLERIIGPAFIEKIHDAHIP